jgi:hypothetical protein
MTRTFTRNVRKTVTVGPSRLLEREMEDFTENPDFTLQEDHTDEPLESFEDNEHDGTVMAHAPNLVERQPRMPRPLGVNGLCPQCPTGRTMNRGGSRAPCCLGPIGIYRTVTRLQMVRKTKRVTRTITKTVG